MLFRSVYSMLGETGKAVKALETAVKAKPHSAGAQFALGNLYSELKRYKDAVKAYKKVVKIKPEFARARFNLGVAYTKLSKKMLSEAKREYRALRKLDKELAKELSKILRGKK